MSSHAQRAVTLFFLVLHITSGFRQLTTRLNPRQRSSARLPLATSEPSSVLEAQNAELQENVLALQARVKELEKQQQQIQQQQQQQQQQQPPLGPPVAMMVKNSMLGTTLGTKNGWNGLTLPSMQVRRPSMAPDDLDDVEEGEWCEVLEDGTPDALCADESVDEFLVALRSRVAWLVGLLTLQSMSSFILSDYEALIQAHPSIVFFLTMLVGAGGNAGNQSAVRIIRGLAVGYVDFILYLFFFGALLHGMGGTNVLRSAPTLRLWHICLISVGNKPTNQRS